MPRLQGLLPHGKEGAHEHRCRSSFHKQRVRTILSFRKCRRWSHRLLSPNEAQVIDLFSKVRIVKRKSARASVSLCLGGAFVRKIIGETLGLLDFLCIFALAKRFSKTNNYKIIESMKRFSTLLLLVACVVMAQAQKLDTQLMLLVGQSGTRGEQVVTNQKVLQDKLCANLNADGSIRPRVSR